MAHKAAHQGFLEQRNNPNTKTIFQFEQPDTSHYISMFGRKTRELSRAKDRKLTWKGQSKFSKSSTVANILREVKTKMLLHICMYWPPGKARMQDCSPLRSCISQHLFSLQFLVGFNDHDSRSEVLGHITTVTCTAKTCSLQRRTYSERRGKRSQSHGNLPKYVLTKPILQLQATLQYQTIPKQSFRCSAALSLEASAVIPRGGAWLILPVVVTKLTRAEIPPKIGIISCIPHLQARCSGVFAKSWLKCRIAKQTTSLMATI